jgi:sugar phosphate isomerase/epimerase
VVDVLDGLPIGDLSLSGFAILVCLLIVTGGIPTRRELRDTRADRDRWQSSADTWQRVATEHGMTLEKHTETLEKLLTGQDAIRHVVEQIQTAGREGTP